MTSFKIYQSGLKALENQNFTEAAELLESYYQASPKPGSLEHYRACKALVKAYEQIDQTESALDICQELIECDKPHIRSWAKRWHEKLSEQQVVEVPPESSDENQATPAGNSEPLTPEEASTLLAEGREALRSQQHDQAIQVLERFQTGINPEHPNYDQARMWLATAYKKTDQLQKAQHLSQQLGQAADPATQAWAQKFLQSLSMVAAVQSVVPRTAPQASPAQTEKPDSEAVSSSLFQQRSLADFKAFCRKNLVDDLKEYEVKRQGAVKAILLGGVVISAILLVILTQAPRVLHSFPLYVPALPDDLCRKAFASSGIREQIIDQVGAANPTAINQQTRAAYSEFQAVCQTSYFSFENLRSFLIFSALFLIGLIVCLWSWAIFYSVQTEMYEHGFKRRIIEKVIAYINNDQDLNYSTFGDNYLTRVAMLKSRLFPALNQTFYLKQDDCVFGQAGPVNIFFSEVVSEHEIYHPFMANLTPFLMRCRGSLWTLPIFVLFLLFSLLKAAPFIVGKMIKGQRFDYDSFKEQVGNQVTRRQVFKGLFFRSEFNKRFQGETTVYADSIAASLKRFSKPKGSLVKLEDPEFSQLFTVYSDDQVEARYILSTSLMERLVQFRKKAQRKVSISFAENQIFIAIHCERDLFEAQLFKSMLSFQPMQDYFENFQLMLGIIEDLNLNRRVWGH